MKFRDAVIECRKLTNQMQEHADASTLASRTYAATLELYNVAAEAADEKAMQLHRDTLHTTVDVILDSGAMLAQLRKKMKDITNDVTDGPE